MGISLSFLNQLTPYSIILKRNKIILHQAATIQASIRTVTVAIATQALSAPRIFHQLHRSLSTPRSSNHDEPATRWQHHSLASNIVAVPATAFTFTDLHLQARTERTPTSHPFLHLHRELTIAASPKNMN